MGPMETEEGPQRLRGPKEFGVQYPYEHRSVLNVEKQSVGAAAGRPEDAVRQLAGDQDSDANGVWLFVFVCLCVCEFVCLC